MKFAEGDVLLSDQRVARVEGLLRMRYPDFPADGQLFSYIQDPVKSADMPRIAVFAIRSPDPKGRGLTAITRGVLRYEAWTKMTWAHERMVGIPDPAIETFDAIVRQHIASVQSIKRSN